MYLVTQTFSETLTIADLLKRQFMLSDSDWETVWGGSSVFETDYAYKIIEYLGTDVRGHDNPARIMFRLKGSADFATWDAKFPFGANGRKLANKQDANTIPLRKGVILAIPPDVVGKLNPIFDSTVRVAHLRTTGQY